MITRSCCRWLMGLIIISSIIPLIQPASPSLITNKQNLIITANTNHRIIRGPDYDNYHNTKGIISLDLSLPLPTQSISISSRMSSSLKSPTLLKRSSSLPPSDAKKSNCGNGLVEDGEQCDFNAPGSRECCDRNCQTRPDLRTLCGNGRLGVCQSGVCMTRQSQCAAFNTMVLSFAMSSTVPDNNDSTTASVKGPFQPCDPRYAQLPLEQRRSQRPSLDTMCTLACEGRTDPGWSTQCIDLRLYGNINSLVADGLLCGDQVLGSTMGVCISGQCQPSSCRQLRCNDRGTCIRMDKSGQAACQCDNPFFGSSCQLKADCDGVVDYCGVCNGRNTTCDTSLSAVYNPNFFKSNIFYYVVIPIVTCAIMIVVAVSAVLAVRKRLFDQRTSKAKFAGKNRFVPSTHSSKIGVSVRWDEYRCLHDYDPQMPDELGLKEGDILFKLLEYDDGWAKGYNTRTQEEGVYPVSFTERMESPVAGAAIANPTMAKTGMTALNEPIK